MKLKRLCFTSALLILFASMISVASPEKTLSLRSMRYTSRTPKEAYFWQQEVRTQILSLLQMDDLIQQWETIPLEPNILSSKHIENYTLQELTIRSTPGKKGRSIPIRLTIPDGPTPPFPAVVCIHGHGGNRTSVYDPATNDKGFATELARRSYITIAADIGQHEIHEKHRTLMGERLWDLIRCIDYLHSLPYVDKGRVGCAGLSLGGEMAMWLGAIDQRIAAVLSSGFLTQMDQLEQNHCMCWKFPGLRERVDFADIYSMIAPRPLQCQNGLQETPAMFTVPLAQETIKEVQVAYRDFGVLDQLELDVHEGGHEIDLPKLVEFFEKNLK